MHILEKTESQSVLEFSYLRIIYNKKDFPV